MRIKRFVIKLVGSWDIAKKLASNKKVIGTGFPKPESVGERGEKRFKKHPVKSRLH